MSQKRTTTRAFVRDRAEFRDQSARTKATCWICGMTIDYDAPFNDYRNDDRFELDHYYPVSTHPELQDDPGNFRPSHAGCNRERGNGAPQANLGILSRDW